MTFNSAEFLFFFPLVLLVYVFAFRRERWRETVLLVASYLFYMSWNWRYAGLLVLSTVVDYSVGRLMAKESRRRVRRNILIASLCSNLGMLCLFKYYNFFVELAGPATTLFGVDVSFLKHELLLPVGISFYTFQTMSYTIDLYRGENVLEKDFLKFSVFVAFFPQLMAGPIVRAKEFLPQLHRVPLVSQERVQDGLLLVFRGLFKKLAIADLLGILAVDKVFANPAAFSSWDLLITLYGYTFQIYNDFSGYSDIARGLARILGFELPVNFNRPYLSQSVREFWTRWHITLSTWLRDYLYISLGGNRAAPWRVRVNLMITMLLGGLWHGAALHFVAWGAYHGFLLMIGRSREGVAEDSTRWGTIRRQLVCFHLIVLGWLLFRIQDLPHLIQYGEGLVSNGVGTQIHGLFYGVLAMAVVLHLTPIEQWERVKTHFLGLPVPVQAGAYALLLVLYCGFTLESPAFIYFQF
ncbi:MAG: MBOAT family protein [Nitrospira sp.]|nr:MBOAT family protein [Nitrospira sp.]